MNSFDEAIKHVPAEAVWSSSFGNPGEAGYWEYHRMPDGTRYVVENSTRNPGAWSVRILRPIQYT